MEPFTIGPDDERVIWNSMDSRLSVLRNAMMGNFGSKLPLERQPVFLKYIESENMVKMENSFINRFSYAENDATNLIDVMGT